MKTSPLNIADQAMSLEVSIDGNILPDNFDIISALVSKKIYEVSNAEVVLRIDINSTNPFAPKNIAKLDVGKKIEIKAGYGSKNQSIFKGTIFKHRIKSLPGQLTALIIRCSDAAHKLKGEEKTLTYTDSKESEIISKIIKDNGLAAAVDTNKEKIKLLNRYESNDWDFINSRARANGKLVYFENDKLNVKKPASDPCGLELTFGQDVIDFDVEYGAKGASLIGNLSFTGHHKPQLNKTIAIKGFGKTVDGDVLITEIDHEIAEGQWTTRIGVGMKEGEMEPASNQETYIEYAVKNILSTGSLNEEIEKSLITILSKKDLTLEYDEEAKIITISTPAGNSVVLSDKDKSIKLNDQNGNKIEMTSNGILIHSKKDLSLKANGKIELESTDNTTINSKNNLSLEGLNVNAKAKVSFSAKGSASAELSASGQTTVKGAMVMIN